MALKLIGAVGLKVRPEAENFRDEAERDIKRQMRGADRDGYKYPIKPEVDNDHMRRELNKSNQDLRDALGDMQKQVDKKKLDLRVNNDKFRKDTQKVRDIYAAMFQDMERRKKIFGDSEAFRIDTDEFENDLREVRHRFNRITEEMDDTEVDIKPVLDESTYRTTWARLKWLTRDRFATIHVKVNKASLRTATNAIKALYGMSGARTGIDFIKDFGRYIRDLDKHIPALGMIGTLATAAVGGVTALVGSVAHLANEFVRMGGAALALPGILGGFAVGVGALIAVLKDFNREVPQIGQDLSDLQDKMSDNFWKQAKIPLMDAWNKAFPHFSKGIQETSTALGKWTAAFSEAFSTHFDMSAFDKMFGNLNKSIDIAALGVDDFVKSMSILGQTGSEYLPRLAQWANEVNESFANWLDQAQKSGQLNDIIDTGIQKLKEFGKLLRETGEWIYLIGSAAERAGFSGFGEMANAMERFNESLKTAKGQEVLDDIFEGAAKIADGFKRALGAVGDFVWESSSMLNELAGIVGDMVGDTFEKMFKAFERPKFQTGLTDFFQGISDGLGHITDKAPEIADLLGSVGSLVGTVAENMGKVVGKIIEVFGPEIGQALEDIAPDLEVMGDAIAGMIDDLGDSGFPEFVGDIIRLAASMASGVAQDVNDLGLAMDAINAFNAGDFEGLEKLNKLAGELSERRLSDKGAATPAEKVPFLGGMFKWIKDSITSWAIWDQISEALEDPMGQWDRSLSRISEWFKSAGEWIAEVWNGFVDWLQGVFSFDGAFVIDDWFPDLWEGIATWWNEQIAEIVDIFNTAKDWLSDVWNGFWDWLTGLFSGDNSDAAGGLAESQGTTSIFDSFNIDSWGDDLGIKLEQAKNWILEKWNEFKGWLGGIFGGGEEGGGAFQIAIDFVMNAIDYASQIINYVMDLANQFGALVRSATVKAIDLATQVINFVRDSLNRFATIIRTATVKARDLATQVINFVRDKLDRFGAIVRTATAKARDLASRVIDNAKDEMNHFGQIVRSATLKALDKATQMVNYVQDKINSLKGKTVSLVTNVIRNFKSNFADGGMVDGNGVQHFAKGGIRSENHVAQIAPAGAMRVWAEPETGGEAYIPFAASKRTRSEAILGQVANKFGMRLERYANGSAGTAPEASSVSPTGDTVNITVESVPTDQAEEVSSAIWFDYKHMKRGGGAFALA